MQFLANSLYTYTSYESLKNMYFSTASHLMVLMKTSINQVFGGETILNFAKVNTVPCIFTAALSRIASL